MPLPVQSKPQRGGRLQYGWPTDLTSTEPDTDQASSELPELDPEAMPFDQLNGFLFDLQDQPAWRGRADVECDYYDSNQYTAQDLAEMRSRGIPPIVVNLIAPTINMVLGLEAKTRSDWIVKPEDESYADEAQGMTKQLKEFERLSGADRACSDAYASQIKAGLGWVEVGINKLNPFGYKFRCQAVHRREIWWDWLDDDPGLEKARYLVRRKWYDVDIAKAFFPRFEKLLHHAVTAWAHFDPSAFDEGVPMYMDQSCERNFAFSDEEWRNSLRKRVCLYEVWYRTYSRGFILRTQNGRVIQYNAQNPIHNAAIVSGAAMPEAAVIPKMRLSWWCGPHRLVDVPSPYPHSRFPYVPFWGFREDRTGIPYGMIRSMKPLQDEVNARRAKMLWQLSARRVMVDDDAVLDHEKTMREISRPDAYVKLNAARKNRGAIGESIQVDDNSQLTAQQFEVYADSKQTLQDSAGVYQQQLGKRDAAADSGIAISQLIEQGTTTLANINSSFRYARTAVGELSLALVQADMAGKPMSVTIEKKGVKKKVRYNQQKTDPTTQQAYLENDVTRMMMRLSLDDVPQTPTFRAQQFMQLTDMVKSLPENLQAVVIDLVIKASDLPQKEELISRIRQSLGIQDTDPELMSPEEQKQYTDALKNKQDLDELQKRLMELEADVQAATAKDKAAHADLNKAQTAKTLVEANIDPGALRGSRDNFVEMTPERQMIENAAAESEQDVPGADPMALERSRHAGQPGGGGQKIPSGPPAPSKPTKPSSKAPLKRTAARGRVPAPA